MKYVNEANVSQFETFSDQVYSLSQLDCFAEVSVENHLKPADAYSRET